MFEAWYDVKGRPVVLDSGSRRISVSEKDLFSARALMTLSHAESLKSYEGGAKYYEVGDVGIVIFDENIAERMEALIGAYSMDEGKLGQFLEGELGLCYEHFKVRQKSSGEVLSWRSCVIAYPKSPNTSELDLN